jgi:hypothetical protein
MFGPVAEIVMRRLLPIGTLLALLPALAGAEELGRITAFLDGEERVWHTITFEQGGKSVSTATWEQKPYLAELVLQGHPVAAFTSKDVLSIDAQFRGQYADGDAPIAIEILYTPSGLAGPLWTSRDAPTSPRLQVVELEAWGRIGRLVAVITGEVCRRPRLFSRTDTTDCKSLSGKISTRLDLR